MLSGAEEVSHTKRQAGAEESGSTARLIVASTCEETWAAPDRDRAHPNRARLAKDPVSVLAIAAVGRRFE